MCGAPKGDHHAAEPDEHSAIELLSKLANLYQEDWRFPVIMLFWLRSKPASYRNAEKLLHKIHGPKFGNHVTIKKLVDRLIAEFPGLEGLFLTTTNAYSRAHKGRSRTNGSACGVPVKKALEGVRERQEGYQGRYPLRVPLEVETPRG